MEKIRKNFSITSAKYIFAFAIVFSLATSEISAQLNALDYRLQKRPKLEKFDSKNFFDHTFVSVAAGVQANFLDKKSGTDFGPGVRYYFGKWFTPVIGARFGMDMSILYHSKEETRGLFGFNLDYMANISAFAAGYNPKRLFELYGILGVTYKRAFSYGYGTNMYGGAVGLQASFRVSPMVSVFLEPKVTIANDSYDGRFIDRNFDLLPELSVGATCNMVPVSFRKTTVFDNRPFRKNIFFSAGVGAQRVITSLMPLNDFTNWFGPSGMIAFGGWFTPIHGLRFSVMGGTSAYKFDMPKSDNDKLGSVAGRLDYLINYSSAFGGYNEKRIFELIGTYGLEFAMSGQTGDDWKPSGGLGLGLQGKFRINPSLDLFMEPRISFYTKNYTNGVDNKFDGSASMLFGVTYHSTDNSYRSNNTDFVQKSKVDHMYMSVSGGVGGLLLNKDAGMTAKESIAAQFSIALGKWITPVSGVQLSGGMITFGTKAGAYHRARAVNIGADYMFNMTNLLCGYEDNRFFEVIFGLGASAFYHNTKFFPAMQGRIQTKFNLKKNWSLFVEPSALWVTKSGVIALTGGSTRKNLILTANIGTMYNMRGYDPASYQAFKENEGSRKFVSLAGGFGSIIYNSRVDDNQKRISPSARLSFGSWMSPISGWRVSIVADKLKSINSEKFITHAGLGAELMLNVTNVAMGYDPDRIFDLNAIGGVHAGFSIVERNMRFIPGFTGGLQGSFRVSSNVSLYLEPQLAIYLNKFDGENKQKSVGMLYVGVTYAIDKRDRVERAAREHAESPNFISFGGGVGLYGNTLLSPYGKFSDNMTYTGRLALGRWITPVHGLRLNGDYTFIKKPYQYTGESMGVASARADYMFNITALASGNNPDRLFDAIAFVGAGAAFPLKDTNTSFDTKATYTLAIGLQAKFNLSKHIDVFVEPRGIFFGDKIDGYKSRAGFDADVSLLAGFNYKF